MLLTCSNVALFHVEQSGGTQEVRDFGSKGRHPQLRGYFTNKLHQPREVLTVQFCRRIVEQQRGPPRSFLLLNLELREHQSAGYQFLLAARNTVFCRLTADLNDDVGSVRTELGRPIAPVAFAVGGEGIEE